MPTVWTECGGLGLTGCRWPRLAQVFLLVEVNSHPFRDTGDNMLALFTGASLVGLFMSCVLLRATELAEFDRVDALLTDETQDIYVSGAPNEPSRLRCCSLTVVLIGLQALSSGGVLLILTSSSVLAIALSVPVLWLSIRAQRREVVLRWTKDDFRVIPRRLPSGQYHTFISHKWSSGQE